MAKIKEIYSLSELDELLLKEKDTVKSKEIQDQILKVQELIEAEKSEFEQLKNSTDLNEFSKFVSKYEFFEIFKDDIYEANVIASNINMNESPEDYSPEEAQKLKSEFSRIKSIIASRSKKSGSTLQRAIAARKGQVVKGKTSVKEAILRRKSH